MSIRTYWHPLGGVDKNLLAPPKNYHVNAGVGAFQLILEYQMVSVGGQILTKDKRPPSLCRQCTAVVFLGLTNTCCNRNGWGCTPSTPQKLHQVHPQEVAPQKLHPGVKAGGAGGGGGCTPSTPRFKSCTKVQKLKVRGWGGAPSTLGCRSCTESWFEDSMWKTCQWGKKETFQVKWAFEDPKSLFSSKCRKIFKNNITHFTSKVSIFIMVGLFIIPFPRRMHVQQDAFFMILQRNTLGKWGKLDLLCKMRTISAVWTSWRPSLQLRTSFASTE